MITDYNNTSLRFVKIQSPFRLSPRERRIFVGGVQVAVAQPAGRVGGEHVYCADVAVIGEGQRLYVTAPAYAAVEVLPAG